MSSSSGHEGVTILGETCNQSFVVYGNDAGVLGGIQETKQRFLAENQVDSSGEEGKGHSAVMVESA